MLVAAQLLAEDKMAKFALKKENSQDIGFASACLICGAVKLPEFKKWAEFVVIESDDDIPYYIFEIMDIKEKFDYTLRMREIVGFQPGYSNSDNDVHSLDGIAFLRFADHKSDFSNKEKAIDCLNKNNKVKKLFKKNFPFIEINFDN